MNDLAQSVSSSEVEKPWGLDRMFMWILKDKKLNNLDYTMGCHATIDVSYIYVSLFVELFNMD
jgi:hypothetical protein